MSTQSSVWVVINSDSVQEKINDYIDAGSMSEATDLDYQLFSIADKINSLISDRGGKVYLCTYSRQVLEMPVTVAEELPLILAGYKDIFKTKMCIGMGLNINEAVKAAQKSALSNEIELFDPKDELYQSMRKSLEIEDSLFQPDASPNVTDRTNPGSPKPTKDKKDFGPYIPGLDPQQAVQADTQLIQGVLQQLTGPAQQMQQQMQQQMDEQAKQQQQQSGSLLESMSGKKKTDKPQTHIAQKEDKESPKKESPKDSDSDEEHIDEDDSDSSDDTNDKIGKLLENIQQKLPQIMDLKAKDPAAFKQSMSLVHKLLDTAKQDRVKKSEDITEVTEELNKMIKLRFPVGTLKGRKKKVIIGGKAVWRSVASGQVQDATTGQAISVAAHNAQADDGTVGTQNAKK